MELSANIWRPVARRRRRPDERFPAILEMIPYGKDNWRRAADMTRGEWFAARGYALCRVDVRGTGSSGGVALDEYTADETRDGYDAVEWLAAQPWCDGAVGDVGDQLRRVHRDPGRGAAAARTCGRSCRSWRTDDRYLDDVHYRGGCVTVSELSQYAVSQVAMNAMPPEAAFRGAGLAGRVAGPARGDAAVAVRLAAPPDRRAVLAPGLAGARLRRDRGRDLQHRRLARQLRRPGVPDAGTLPCPVAHARRQLGPFVAARRGARARTSTSCTRSPGSSIDTCAASDNGWDAEPPIVWFEREFAPPDAVPGRRCRVAGGRPTAYPHPETTIRALVVRRGRASRGRAP